MMTNETLTRILTYFDEILPEAGCELNYRQPHELLIAVMLSAQTSDASVNRVTPILFSRFNSVEALAQADREEVETIIRSIGLFKTKAKNIIAAMRMMQERFSGAVPSDKAFLTSLPGVGIKTANVVRAELFHIPEIAVDTHVTRIAKRLGFVKMSDDVTTIEKKLRKRLPIERYIKTHHQMIHFGRYYCQARGMKCAHCPLVDICHEKNKNLAVEK